MLTTGHRELWTAVLERAAQDLRGERLERDDDPEAVRQEALTWLGNPDFDEVCSLAGLPRGTVLREMLILG